ncbi:MAG: tetratricopeptide repeat protein [Phycisphaerales bacterium]|nr:tetratricopeptide repeat protein [Phycisphaerales bacterium]
MTNLFAAGRRPARYAAILCAALLASGCASSSARKGPPKPTLGPSPADITAAFEMAGDAQDAEARGRTDEAIAKYRAALSSYREFPAAWNNLGVVLMDQGRFLEAGECFAAASDLAPFDPRPTYNLGLTWDRAGYMDEALRYYNRALERDARYLPALRGSIRTERLMGAGDAKTLERLKAALLLEQDPRWREWLELQRLRLEAEIRQTAVGAR